MDITQRALSGTVLTVESALFPTLTIDLGAEGQPVDPSPLLGVLRPRVTVTRDGLTLLRQAPGGAPEDAPPYAMLAAVAMLAALLWVAFR